MGHVGCTGWRRVIGCLKSQVIFRKRVTNYRVLLRKITYEDKASYDPTPPCNNGIGGFDEKFPPPPPLLHPGVTLFWYEGLLRRHYFFFI